MFNMNKAISKSTRKTDRKVKSLQNDVGHIQRRPDEADIKMDDLQNSLRSSKGRRGRVEALHQVRRERAPLRT
eukprot:7145044-Pyramimonas_sp.AAC.1